MVVKIPIEDFTNVTLAKLLLELVIGVADMEVDKMFIAASHSYSKFEELKEHQSWHVAQYFCKNKAKDNSCE